MFSSGIGCNLSFPSCLGYPQDSEELIPRMAREPITLNVYDMVRIVSLVLSVFLAIFSYFNDEKKCISVLVERVHNSCGLGDLPFGCRNLRNWYVNSSFISLQRRLRDRVVCYINALIMRLLLGSWHLQVYLGKLIAI